MSDHQSILKTIPEALKVDLIQSIKAKGKYASGRTTDQLEATATEGTAQLLAPWHIMTLENGRKPTKPGTPAGDPTLFEVIKEWCVARSIDPAAAWPITQHIHKYGFKGVEGVISEPLSDSNVNKRVDEAVGKLASIITTEFGDLLKI